MEETMPPAVICWTRWASQARLELAVKGVDCRAPNNPISGGVGCLLSSFIQA